MKVILKETVMIGKRPSGNAMEYLYNPTASELIKMMQSSMYKTLRMIYYDHNLYAFDGNKIVHWDFIQKNREIFPDPESAYRYGSLLLVDPFENSHGTSFVDFEAILNNSRTPESIKSTLREFLKYVNKKYVANSTSSEKSTWKELFEKRVKMNPNPLIPSMGLVYIQNPTPFELFSSYNVMRSKVMRGIVYKNNMYFWDAQHHTHMTFITQHRHLFDGKTIDYVSSDCSFLQFDPFLNDTNTYFLALKNLLKSSSINKKIKKTIIEFMQLFYKHVDGKFSENTEWTKILSSPLYNPYQYSMKESFKIFMKA